MRIINLIEDTNGVDGCAFLHGLSFYIETGDHKILFDLGPSADTLQNAGSLGVDPGSVDTVILSHGHYDHSGGIIPFAGLNKTAVIIMQKNATDDFYSDKGAGENDRYRYIGIDKSIADLAQARMITGDLKIDDGLSLFVMDDHEGIIPFTNRILMRRDKDEYVRDDFTHEQFLVVREGDVSVLFSGCAHSGIVNIMREYKRKFASEPDIVVSGFHLKKKTDYTADERKEIEDMAKELMSYRSVFYTCHCTGLPAFDIMKQIMKERLKYVHSGYEINFPVAD